MSRLSARRVLSGFILVLVAALLPGLASSSAQADDASTLTIVGTSDVSDSGLIQFLTPLFKQKFPQYTNVNYVPQGTGAAIQTAEQGAASALLVHAASVENQFVGSGFSLEPFGRAIFWGDYVLVGPASDPAHVMDGGFQHDIVGAFEAIAAAGAADQANFVSRGNTAGTPIQEHAIWALTQGVQTCDVSGPNGGGTAPSTATGPCPDVITTLQAPDWYHITNVNQGLNVQNGNVCNYPTAAAGNNCYVFTDRGTFQNLQHQPVGNPPVDTNTVSNLTLMTRDNHVPGKPDQDTLLVNSFHAYAINPDKFAGTPAVQLNVKGATDFLDWLTSPDGQAAVASYLSAGGDPPFIPDAAPSITTSALPASVAGGKRVKVSGSVTNVVPGTPKLNDVRVTIIGSANSETFTAAKGLTGPRGKFNLSFLARRNATYTVHTAKVTKVEIDTLHPVFGDILQPSDLSLGALKVTGTVNVTSAKGSGKKLTVGGTLAPKDLVKAGNLQLWAAHPGKALKEIGSKPVAVGASKFNDTFTLGKGTWKYQVRYANRGVITTGSSATKTITLG